MASFMRCACEDGRVSSPHSNIVAGWREWVSLPDLGVPWVKAKLDTGARSSALHAFDIQEVERDGVSWVRFRVQPWQRSSDDAVEAELPVHDRRRVRSSSGHIDERVVVQMDVELVGRTVTAEVTLSRRDEMGFRMLIGREALRGEFVVDPGRSYLGGRPKKRERRKNRGR
jgi:hypothetical protein